MRDEIPVKCLKIVSDTKVFHDCFLKKERYYIFSESRDKYLKISKEQYLFLGLVLPHLDGTKNKQQIESDIYSEYGIELHVDAVVKMIAEQGFFEEMETSRGSKVEMDLYSDSVVKINLKGIYQRFIKFDGIIVFFSYFHFLSSEQPFFLLGTQSY